MLNRIKQRQDIEIISEGKDGIAFRVREDLEILRVVANIGEGWDHVTVSLVFRIPTWLEMCFIKDMTFGPDVVAMQLHPKQSDYINNHPYVLHMWHPHKGSIPMPPNYLVY